MTPEALVQVIAEFHAIKLDIAERSGARISEVEDAIRRQCGEWTIDPTPVDLLVAARALRERLYGHRLAPKGKVLS